MRARLLLLCILWASLARAQSLVIHHVTVIDATGKPPHPDRTVIVARGHIAGVTPSKKASSCLTYSTR